MTHKFKPGDIVVAKSGNLYRIQRLRSDNHPKLKGEIGYDTTGQRNGRNFGPSRLMRESAFTGLHEEAESNFPNPWLEL